MESPSKRQKQEVTCCSHEQLQSLATEILVKHGANQQGAHSARSVPRHDHLEQHLVVAVHA